MEAWRCEGESRWWVRSVWSLTRFLSCGCEHWGLVQGSAWPEGRRSALFSGSVPAPIEAADDLRLSVLGVAVQAVPWSGAQSAPFGRRECLVLIRCLNCGAVDAVLRVCAEAGAPEGVFAVIVSTESGRPGEAEQESVDRRSRQSDLAGQFGCSDPVGEASLQGLSSIA